MTGKNRKKFRVGFTAVGMIFLGILYLIRYGLPETGDSDRYPPSESGEGVVSEEGGTFENTASAAETDEGIVVHVDGAVRSPGVYELESGARVNDAVEKAGGVTENAELSEVNLALAVSDGMKIHIPVQGEEIRRTAAANAAGDGLVNINTASEEELTALPGIGESKAKAIIRYREENGAFGCIEDIKNVNGIGDGMFLKLKDLITV